MKLKKPKCAFGLDEGKLASLFKALGETNRLSIFNYLCGCRKKGEEDSNVKEIANCCEVDLSVVSRHLGVLKKAGVLNAEKSGKEVRYSLNSKELASNLRELADFIDNCCSDENSKGVKNE